MKLGVTKASASSSYNGLGDQLYDLGGARPTLDLNFSSNGSLVDSVTGKTLVDHTRQSSATYVDGDGVIRTAVTNLLLQSEDFSTSWLNTSSTETINATTAPDGTLTADKIIPDNGASDGQVRQDITKTASAITYTLSCYGKRAEFDSIYLLVADKDASVNKAEVGFSLVNGSITTAASVGGTFTSASGASQALVDDWYRFSLTFTSGTETSLRIRLYADSTGDGTSGIYLWGAQLEQSSTVGQYVKTTTAINSAPRFDHDPTTGESLGLLVEESRQNLLLNSVWAGATTGTPGSAPTNWVTEFGTNTETALVSSIFGSADGAQAIKFSADSGERIMFRQTINVVSGTTYTLSVNVESIVGSIGKVLTVIAGTASRTIISGDVDTTNSGKAVLVFTADSTGTVNIRVGVGTTSTVGATVQATLSRPQLEAGSFATSYIPTEGSTVTRAADVASITGTNFSSWYNDSEGTSLIEFREPDRSSPRTPRSFSDGTASNRWDAFLSSTSTANHRVVISNASNNPSNLTLSVGNLLNKHVIAVGSPNANAACNGTLATSNTSSAVPSVNRLIIGADSIGNTPLTGTIRRLTYWPTRLSNDTLQTITA